MATNSLSTEMVFSSELVGGPKMVRPSHYLLSTLIRASTKTFSDADAQVRQLEKASLLGSTLASVAKHNLTAQGWDAVPFCLIHQLARKGVTELDVHGNGLDSATPNNIVVRVLRDYRDRKIKGSRQAALHRNIKLISLDDWKLFLERKASIIVPDHGLSIEGSF